MRLKSNPCGLAFAPEDPERSLERLGAGCFTRFWRTAFEHDDVDRFGALILVHGRVGQSDPTLAGGGVDGPPVDTGVAVNGAVSTAR